MTSESSCCRLIIFLFLLHGFFLLYLARRFSPLDMHTANGIQVCYMLCARLFGEDKHEGILVTSAKWAFLCSCRNLSLPDCFIIIDILTFIMLHPTPSAKHHWLVHKRLPLSLWLQSSYESSGRLFLRRFKRKDTTLRMATSPDCLNRQATDASQPTHTFCTYLSTIVTILFVCNQLSRGYLLRS